MTDKKFGTVLVLGAASDMGRAIARAFAPESRHIILAARAPTRLEADLNDLRIRSQGQAESRAFDVLDTASHPAFLAGLPALPDVVICVVGLLGDQQAMETDFAQADLVMRTNYLGPASILGEAASRMQARGSGTIIGIGSVAGDRGRASNYIYGSAKAGFAAFLSGLRNRLGKSGVHVLTVKPGFVNTKMTEGMKLPPLLTAQPDEVAAAILNAAKRGATVIYVKPVWRLIMLIIRLLPERIFMRTKL